MDDLVPPDDQYCLLPGHVAASDLQEWSQQEPIAFRLAQAWANHAPRATSWLPRKIGRAFGRSWRLAIQTPRGCLLSVDPTNLDIYTTIRHHDWEPAIFQMCCRLLRPGDVFLDVGANVGYVALGIGVYFRGNVRLIAVEPQPSLARNIILSASLNGLKDVIVVRAILGTTNQSALLYLPPHAVHASMMPRGRTDRSITCPVRRLDDLVSSDSIPAPTVMKVDVEGAELDVFTGARSLLTEQPPCLVFESDQNMDRFSYTRSDVLAFLRTCTDYTFYGVRADGSLASPTDGCSRDILALPPQWRSRLRV